MIGFALLDHFIIPSHMSSFWIFGRVVSKKTTQNDFEISFSVVNCFKKNNSKQSRNVIGVIYTIILHEHMFYVKMGILILRQSLGRLNRPKPGGAEAGGISYPGGNSTRVDSHSFK